MKELISVCQLCDCGNCHDADTQCDCPSTIRSCICCNVWHVTSSCLRCSFEDKLFNAGSCTPCNICGVWHGADDCVYHAYVDSQCAGDTMMPCYRCNVWHGADVCVETAAQIAVCGPSPSRSLLRDRAVASMSSSSLYETHAPAHSDSASDCHNVGCMSMACTHCGARFWRGEKIECCFEGSLIIPEPIIPQSLSDLILSTSVRPHLRSYNMAMAMASVGHNKTGFPDGVFAMSGKSYHRIGSLVPRTGQPPSFAQIYALDTAAATDRRSQLFGDRLNAATLRNLHDQLKMYNRYVSDFCRAAENDVQELVWTTHDDIMGMQMGSLVCAIGTQRAIVIKRSNNESSPYDHDLQMISDGHSLYHTLAYPLLFPTGAPGWFQGMTRCERDGVTRRLVSLHDYGRYMLMHRERSASVLLI